MSIHRVDGENDGSGQRQMAGGESPVGLFAEFTSVDDLLIGIFGQVVTARLVAALTLTERAGETSEAESSDAPE